MVDEQYGVVDMAFWGWARLLPHILGADDATWGVYPNVQRLLCPVNTWPSALEH
jgi:GST-like protein